MELRASIDLSAARRQLARLGEVFRNPRPILDAFAEWLRGTTRGAFEQQRSPEGAAWAPNSLQWARRKAKIRPGRRILNLFGKLERTFAGVKGDTAFVENRVVYARIHQHGGLTGRGHKARIPARPFQPGLALMEREGRILADEFVQEQIDAAERG